jgi:transcription antitermination factor NusG
MTNSKPKYDIVINQLSAEEKRWFAVYTKYKCEKYVSENLARKSIEAYVPLISKTKRYARKIKNYEVPLINCYVFVFITKSEYIGTLETEYVMKFLRQGKDLLAIPEVEIDVLKRIAGDIIEANSIDTLDFEAGEEVEVIAGHLAGMKGKIISKSGKKNFVIDLETIGYQLRIKVDLNLLRPLGTRLLTH